MRFRPCTVLSQITALAFVFCLQISGAFAQSMEWTVIESTGSVLVVQPLVAARPVSLQDVMAPGSIVTTGGDGHAELRRGGQSIAIGPNSRIALPAAETGGVTKIIQDFGAALFKVDKQQNPHFEVDTPMIAAVVKGTTFTVSAGSADDSVHVVEGLVQVAPRSGGAPVPVPAGVTAVILHNNPGTIDLKQSNTGGAVAPMPAPTVAPIQDASNAIPQPIGAEPLDVKQLTNGLAVTGSATRSAAAAPSVQSVAAPTEPAAAPSVALENPGGASTTPISAGPERSAATANVAAIVQDNGGHAAAASGKTNTETGAGSNASAAGNTSGDGTSVVAAGNNNGGSSANGSSNATADTSSGNANAADGKATVAADAGKKDGHAKPVNENANANANANGNAVAEDSNKSPAQKDDDKGKDANANGTVIAAAGTSGEHSGTNETTNGNGNVGPIAVAAGNGGTGKDNEDAGKDKGEKGKAAPRGLMRP